MRLKPVATVNTSIYLVYSRRRRRLRAATRQVNRGANQIAAGAAQVCRII